MEAHPISIAGRPSCPTTGPVPRYFGEDGSLYGIWTRADRTTRRRHGVLLAPPIAHEHVRSHWALRQATAMLARAGFDVLRFDWFGVGDSLGELSEASLTRWQHDLAAAAAELRELTGVARVSAVGLRLGATIAASSSDLIRLSSLVLWDPVVEGASYLNEQRRMTDHLLADTRRFWFPADAKARRPAELVGFDYGVQLQAEIERVAIHRLPRVPVCLLRTGSCGDTDPALAHLKRVRPDLNVADASVEWNWNNTEDVERMLLPGDAVRKLTAFLEASA